MTVNVKDRVRVIDREPTTADVKSGLFYGYFRNLTGVVERVYDDTTLCVDVDIDSLPEDVRARHTDVEKTARDKWIAGLSGEQRGRLTEQDKQFNMRYKIVIASEDVVSEGKKSAKSSARSAGPVEAKAATDLASKQATPDKAKPAAEPKPVAKKEKPAAPANTAPNDAPKRLTQKDLDAQEREFLKSLKSRGSAEGSNSKSGT